MGRFVNNNQKQYKCHHTKHARKSSTLKFQSHAQENQDSPEFQDAKEKLAPLENLLSVLWAQWVLVVCLENQEFQDALDLSVKQELKAQPEHQELKVIQESQDAQDLLDLVVKKEIVVPQVFQERLYTSMFMMTRNTMRRNTMGNMMKNIMKISTTKTNMTMKRNIMKTNMTTKRSTMKTNMKRGI